MKLHGRFGHTASAGGARLPRGSGRTSLAASAAILLVLVFALAAEIRWFYIVGPVPVSPYAARSLKLAARSPHAHHSDGPAPEEGERRDEGSGGWVDPDPIHVLVAACGYPVEDHKYYGLVALKSLLIAKTHSRTRRHYVLHIASDMSEERLFNTTRFGWEMWRVLQREKRSGRVDVRYYRIRDLEDSADAVIPDSHLLVPKATFKQGSAARLRLPFLLNGTVQRLLYVDWDSTIHCDLTHLWSMWAEFEADPQRVFGLALIDPSGVWGADIYRDWKLPHPDSGGLNAGVMMMHIGRLAANNFSVTRELFTGIADIIASRNVTLTGDREVDYWSTTGAFGLGDQDWMNMLMSNGTATWCHPRWLFLLEYNYNWCGVPPWLDDVPEERREAYERDIGAGGRPGPPCIMHHCGANIFPEVRGGKPHPITHAPLAMYMAARFWPLERDEAPPGIPPGHE